jgi:outer membrane lipoprotein-sorting protein
MNLVLALLAYTITCLAPQSTPDMFSKLMRSSRIVSVDVSIRLAADATSIAGKLYIKRPASFRFDLKANGLDQSIIKSGDMVLEIDREAGSYYLRRGQPSLGAVRTILADMAGDVLPIVLLDGSVDVLKPKNIPYKVVSSGAEGDQLVAEWSDSGSEGKISVTLTKTGKLTSYSQHIKTSQGVLDRSFTFANYQFDTAIAPSLFSLVPPTGLEAFALLEPPTLSVGDKLDWSVWNGVERIGKGKFLIIFDPDSALDTSFVNTFRQLGKGLPSVYLSLGAKGGALRNPPASLKAKLQAGGTPLVVWRGKDGTLKRMWIGYDPSTIKRNITEMKEVLSEEKG